MRKNLDVAVSVVVIFIGITLLTFAFFPEFNMILVEPEQWNLAASQVLQKTNSFTADLTRGYYRISATGGEASPLNSPFLQIVNSELIEIDGIAEGEYAYFWINSSDNYSFYFINWYSMPNNSMSARIDSGTCQTVITYPNSFVAPIGVVVCLAGLGVLVYGLIARRRLPVEPP